MHDARELLKVRVSCLGVHREEPVQSLGIELDTFMRKNAAAPTNREREEITLLPMQLEVMLMAHMEEIFKDLCVLTFGFGAE